METITLVLYILSLIGFIRETKTSVETGGKTTKNMDTQARSIMETIKGPGLRLTGILRVKKGQRFKYRKSRIKMEKERL